MWIKRPVRCDLAFESELFRVGWKQQFDRGGVKANSMIQPLDSVLRVESLDGDVSVMLAGSRVNNGST